MVNIDILMPWERDEILRMREECETHRRKCWNTIDSLFELPSKRCPICGIAWFEGTVRCVECGWRPYELKGSDL